MKALVVLLLVAAAVAVPRRPVNKFKTDFPWPDGRIVGGRDADITEFPHQISLQFLDFIYCGGSIISEKYILTAAQCTHGFPTPDGLQVRYNTSIVEDGGILVKIAQIHENPDYNRDNLNNDVSILELAEELTFGPGAQPIALPDADDKLAAGTVVTVSGWGNLQYGNYELSDQLQAVDVNIVDHEECKKDYEVWANQVSDTMICASVPEGGKDACLGDSGGPLVADGKLYGIVSWGNECALANYPGVYTDVTVFRDFINKITGL